MVILPGKSPPYLYRKVNLYRLVNRLIRPQGIS